MAFPSKGSPGAFTSDPSSNPAWLIDHFIMQMVLAESEKSWWKRWVCFKFVMNRITPYMETNLRKLFEEDHQKELEYELEIENEDISEQSKTKKIEQLRNTYIDTHYGYISMTLPRAGIVTLSEDGELDVEAQEEYELVRTIIREQKGAAPSHLAKSCDKRGENVV